MSLDEIGGITQGKMPDADKEVKKEMRQFQEQEKPSSISGYFREKFLNEQQLSPDVVIDEVKQQLGFFLKDFNRSERDISVDRVGDEVYLNFNLPLIIDGRAWVAVEVGINNIDSNPVSTIKIWNWKSSGGRVGDGDLGKKLVEVGNIELAHEDLISELEDALDQIKLSEVE